MNFSKQRNRALDEAETSWVFFIDADERLTAALAIEIAAAVRQSGPAAWNVPRRNIFFGHEVKHTGWSPDYQVRLLRRELCRYDEEREVHEVPLCRGTTGTLRQPLIHYNYSSWAHFFAKQRAYAELDARALLQAGTAVRPRALVGRPLRELKRRLVDYQGYKDGLLGVALSVAMAGYAFDVQRRLLLLRRRRR